MREEITWWYKSAKINLKRAKRAFEDKDYEACAFWSHQAVEFSLKALIIKLGHLPPRTRNLRRLYESCKGLIELNEQILSELTPYYSVSRYPDIFMEIPTVHKDTAKKFLEFAEEIIKKTGELVGS